MAAGDFERDFGYLMPFIDRVAEAAGRLADPSARDELNGLVAGQKERWARIREILSSAAAEQPPAGDAAGDKKQHSGGAASRPGGGPRAAVTARAGGAVARRMAETKAAKDTFQGTEVRSFTVGSLRPRAR